MTYLVKYSVSLDDGESDCHIFVLYKDEHESEHHDAYDYNFDDLAARLNDFLDDGQFVDDMIEPESGQKGTLNDIPQGYLYADLSHVIFENKKHDPKFNQSIVFHKKQ